MRLAMLSRCAAALLAASLASAGCSRNDVGGTVAAMNHQNIQRVANLYMAYQMRTGWTGPPNETAFRDFIQQKMAPEKLQLMRIDANDLDALFLSERDGKSFKIRYGLRGGPYVVAAVVFEQEGRDGGKQVGFTNGTVEEADDVRYQQLWAEETQPGAATSPPAGPPADAAPVGAPK